MPTQLPAGAGGEGEQATRTGVVVRVFICRFFISGPAYDAGLYKCGGWAPGRECASARCRRSAGYGECPVGTKWALWADGEI